MSTLKVTLLLDPLTIMNTSFTSLMEDSELHKDGTVRINSNGYPDSGTIIGNWETVDD